uniref:Uncharacterized protein n=1 Tax=Panagrolaimus sp. PS1159 TaxID=55785 RepID=A0AC35F006_9BILA
MKLYYYNTLTGSIAADNFESGIYNEVWDKFKNVVPEHCYVFLILDGKHIPIPKFKRKKQNEYDAMNDHDDVLITNFDMTTYLDSIVGIGIENNTERQYKMLQNCKNTVSI